MTQYIWYSPEYDVIVLQTFMDEYSIHFEWGIEQALAFIDLFGRDVDFMEQTLWFPIGML